MECNGIKKKHLSTQQQVLDSKCTVSKRTTDVRTANVYKSAHVTACALKHRCPTYRTNV